MMSDEIKNGLKVIKQAFEEDFGYAWAWHCNLAMASYDEGLDLAAANRAAARFIRILLDYDITESEEFKNTQKEI